MKGSGSGWLVIGLAIAVICVIEFTRQMVPRIYASLSQSSRIDPAVKCLDVTRPKKDLLQKAIDRQYGRSTDPERIFQMKLRDNILVAMVGCQPESCSGEDLKRYKHDAKAYVKKRKGDFEVFYKWEGSDGIYKVREFYDTAQDDKIVAGLQSRYRAGLISLRDFRAHHRDAAALLLLGTKNRLPICEPRTKTDRA